MVKGLIQFEAYSQTIGSTPHYYVNRNASDSVKKSSTYIQYTQHGYANGTEPKFYKQIIAYEMQVNGTSGYGKAAEKDGCGAFSITNIVGGCVDPNISPLDVYNYMVSKGYLLQGTGTTSSGIIPTFEHFGITNVTPVPNNEDVKQALMDGKWVICSVGNGKWCGGSGHFLVLYGYDPSNDHVFLSDSADNTDPHDMIEGSRSYASWSEFNANMRDHVPSSRFAIDPKNPTK